ncbi:MULTISPECIES: glycosyltransferase [unclassified Haematobacter]|uniref:glycosyltransferase n=1 Tax=unclassified Haematobacter TaxID=2640585 RepID=UPI0025C55AC8|nr:MULTISPECIES: glycosyltransferase [unclassified Haematobacter]
MLTFRPLRSGQPLRVAVVSTIYRATPPNGYGGIERVVHEYCEELIRQGHDVTLFAREGSRSSGRLIPIPAPGRELTGVNKAADRLSEEPLYEIMKAALEADPVDVIHDWSFENLYVLRHPERFPFLISSCIPVGPDYQRPNIVAAGRGHAEAIGGGMPHVNYGVDLSRYRFVRQKTAPIVHIAKVAPYKAQHEAILAALRAGVPLDIYGVPEHRLYYSAVVRPLTMLGRGISWKGETNDLPAVLGAARALVQTPRWMDALPMVVIQALACGTPVIAYRSGGLPEQIDHGVSGFLVDGTKDLAEAMRNVGQLDPAACRRWAEERFDVARMARDYVHLFERVREGEAWIGGPAVPGGRVQRAGQAEAV